MKSLLLPIMSGPRGLPMHAAISFSAFYLSRELREEIFRVRVGSFSTLASFKPARNFRPSTGGKLCLSTHISVAVWTTTTTKMHFKRLERRSISHQNQYNFFIKSSPKKDVQNRCKYVDESKFKDSHQTVISRHYLSNSHTADSLPTSADTPLMYNIPTT